MVWLAAIFGSIAAVATTTVFVLWTHYRRIIKKKNEGLVQHIFAQKEIQKKMECAEIEKKMMERVLQEKFEAVVFLGKLGIKN